MGTFTKSPRTGIGTTLVVALVLMVLAVGCGKKGPPRSPQRPSPPAIGDLNARIEGKWAVLTWTVPTSAAVQARVAGFYVHSAKTAAGAAPCEGCPPAFRQVGEVVFQPTTEALQPMDFKVAVEPHGIYLFKVSAYEKDGEQVDSNIVRVETK